ncbi:kinase-like domain-containing protein [Astrocystis sublimbata]|nr:kinase-like domain-containing protein [Astrocystis sublimbata]
MTMTSSRANKASSADVFKGRLLASGTFKNVYAGKYSGGPIAGQPCVAKEFKTGSVYEERYFEEEMNIIKLTQKVIDEWNTACIINKKVLLNTPQIWTFKFSGAKALVEPMIDNFEKFNSNTGWAPVTGGVWSEAMQALSHFSYDNSGGELLLCDIQGGYDQNQDVYILSDPVIMSESQSYGPADLGPDGIRSFFSRHECGRFCEEEWQKPKVEGPLPLLPKREGTMMVTRLPLRSSPLRSSPLRSSRNSLARVKE